MATVGGYKRGLVAPGQVTLNGHLGPKPTRRPQARSRGCQLGPPSPQPSLASALRTYPLAAWAVNQPSSCCWPPYAVRAGQPGGEGWIRLSPRGVQEGQEVDPVQPPVPSAARQKR